MNVDSVDTLRDVSKFDDEHDKRLRAIQAMSDELDVLWQAGVLLEERFGGRPWRPLR